MAGALEKARIAFTGKMASMPRSAAWEIVRANGGEPAEHVSHRTTMLVIGAGGWPILPDGQIRQKVKRAEELQSAGYPIRIVPELEFLTLVGKTPAAPEAAQCYSAADVCRIEAGLYSEAFEAFHTVLTMEPESSPAYCHLGEITHELGILWAAEEMFVKAARMEDGVAAPWLSLAAVQEEQGKIEDAISSYQRALAISPDNADGHFNLALCYEKAGHPTKACRHWFSYLKLDSISPSAQVAKRHLSICPSH